MAEPARMEPAKAAPHDPPATCSRCDKPLAGDDRVAAGDRAFCRSCYETLRHELQQAAEAMSRDVNHPMGAIGSLLGATAGALIWWGVTVLTHIGFGLIAVVIGFLAGHGAVRFTGGKRTPGLQAIAVAASLLGFLAASYLVNATFVNRALGQEGETWRLGFPASLAQFVKVVSINFGIMDVVFLGIAVWQAWAITRPLKLPAGIQA